MASVTFDSVELVSTSYAPRTIDHESIPPKEVSLLPLARENGGIFVAEKYGTKHIIITGSLKATSQSALETAIDSFKELFSRNEKNLDISWEGGTRRYVATCIRHNFNREHMNITFVPWVAEFIVAAGIGEATSEATLLSGQTFNTGSDETGTFTFAGSAEPKPRIRIKLDGATTTAEGFELSNTDRDERLIITRDGGFGADKYIEIDCRLKTVKYDGDEVDFYGVFPKWIVGANAFKLTYYRIVGQQFTGGGSPSRAIYANLHTAQSFTIPHADSTYRQIALYLDKTGSPPNSLTVEIQTDNNGEPSGSLVSLNATNVFLAGDITTEGWYNLTFVGGFDLEANTRYWIVVYTTLGDGGNFYGISMADGVSADYKRGHCSLSANAGASWIAYADRDINFKLYYGGAGDAARTATYDVYYYKQYL